MHTFLLSRPILLAQKGVLEGSRNDVLDYGAFFGTEQGLRTSIKNKKEEYTKNKPSAF